MRQVNMRIIVTVLAVVAVAIAEESFLTDHPDILWPYHEKVGIPAMARITQQEQATDFDGSRIIAGSLVSAGRHPYLGGIIIHLDWGTSICGSSLLTNTRALTAAHCWDDGYRVALGFTVVYGSALLNSGGVRRPALEVVMHPNWNTRTLANDIAIIRHDWVTFTDLIRPIPLPSGSDLDGDFSGTLAVASGFGLTDQFTSGEKREATLQVISNAACRGQWGQYLLNSMVCSVGSGPQGLTGVCTGDSGGPLAVGSGNDRVLVGVTSFGPAGCPAGGVYVFSRVSSYISWIVSNP